LLLLLLAQAELLFEDVMDGSSLHASHHLYHSDQLDRVLGTGLCMQDS
jgi:hypothetical protein